MRTKHTYVHHIYKTYHIWIILQRNKNKEHNNFRLIITNVLQEKIHSLSELESNTLLVTALSFSLFFLV